MSHSFKIWRILLVFIFCLPLAAISCSHRNREQGYVYYRLNTNPTTLDPALIVDVPGGIISAKLFNGLVRLDDDLNIVSDIAEKWSVSKDGLSYLFHLKHNISFSNKREVKASDFKYSFKRILNPKTHSPNIWVLEKIAGAHDFSIGKTNDVSGIRIIDDYTIEIRLDKPFSPFLQLLTMPAAYVVAEEEVMKWANDFSSHPVGTGPFTLRKWLPNRELRLERREDYFEKKAMVNGIVYKIIPEELTTVTEFEIGNLDVISVPAAQFAKYRDSARWKAYISAIEGIDTYYIGMNCSRPPFNNVNLRRAMNLAIDREKLFSTFFEKRGRLAVGPVPDVLRKWADPLRYAYSAAEAREIVSREGFEGRSIRFYITSDPEVVDMAEFIQAYLRKTGLDVKLTQLEWSAYKEAINKGEADMFWLSWWADYPDPEDFLYPLFHSSNIGPAGNRTRYKNPDVDLQIELGQVAADERQRNLHYKKAEEMIVEDAPWVFFWHRNDYTVRQPWIKDYKIYPIYSMDKGTDISLEH